MAHLEQRLLSGFAAAVFVGLSLITLRDANSIGWGWLALVWVLTGLALPAWTVASMVTHTLRDGWIYPRPHWRQIPLMVCLCVVLGPLSWRAWQGAQTRLHQDDDRHD